MKDELPITQGTSFVAYSGIYFDYVFFSDNSNPTMLHLNHMCKKYVVRLVANQKELSRYPGKISCHGLP